MFSCLIPSPRDFSYLRRYTRWLQRQHFIDMLMKFEISIDKNTKQLESDNAFYMFCVWYNGVAR